MFLIEEIAVYGAIVFDILGTLIHVESLIPSSLAAVLPRYGLELPDARTMRLCRLLPVYSFVRAYYELDADRAAAIADEIRAEQHASCCRLAKAYDGAADTLSSLREQGLRFFAVSSRSPAETAELLEHTGLRSCIDTIFQRKGRNGFLREVVAAAGLEPENILFAGDSVDDMDEAELTGCGFLPCTYGYGFEPWSSSVKLPVPVLNDIRELPAVLGELQK